MSWFASTMPSKTLANRCGMSQLIRATHNSKGTAEHGISAHHRAGQSTAKHSTAQHSTAQHICETAAVRQPNVPHKVVCTLKAECKVQHTHGRHVSMLRQRHDLNFWGKHIREILILVPPVMPVAMERLLNCLSQAMLEQCPGRSQQQL